MTGGFISLAAHRNSRNVNETGKNIKVGKPHVHTHLIGQDAIEAALVDGHQPVQADVLVLAQGTFQQEWHLLTTDLTSVERPASYASSRLMHVEMSSRKCSEIRSPY